MANSSNCDGVISFETALRAMALCVTLLAAVVACFDTKTCTIAGTAYWYLALANVIISVYLAGSLIYSVMYHHKKVHTALPFLLPDTFLWAILFATANLAARTLGITGLNGFSIVITLFGCFMFLWLPIISILSLRQRHI